MPSTVVGQILRQSRERNHRLNLSGALLFDGERFCQLLEGECGYCDHEAFETVMLAAASDPQHALQAFMHLLAGSDLST